MVILSIIVDKNGSPSSLRVVKSLDPGLDQAAINAVREWRFQPGTLSGKPVDVEASVTVTFRHDKQLGDASFDALADSPKVPQPAVAPVAPVGTAPGAATAAPVPAAATIQPDMTKPHGDPLKQPANRHPTLRQNESSAVRWEPNCFKCDHRWERGVLQKGLMIDGVTTWLSVSQQANRFVMSVAVINDSKHAIDVRPEGFSLRVVDPPGKWIGALPIEKVQSKRSRNATAPDQQAQTQKNGQEQDQRRDQINRQLADTILLANTVNPGGEIDGLVYFPKEVKRPEKGRIGLASK
jgi:TonB family protein